MSISTAPNYSICQLWKVFQQFLLLTNPPSANDYSNYSILFFPSNYPKLSNYSNNYSNSDCSPTSPLQMISKQSCERLKRSKTVSKVQLGELGNYFQKNLTRQGKLIRIVPCSSVLLKLSSRNICIV